MSVKRLLQTLTIGAAILSSLTVAAGPAGGPGAPESKEARDARMKWWREAKFGMFIHWGVYAVPAGTYEGSRSRAVGEWIMLTRKDPRGRVPAFRQAVQPGQVRPRRLGRLAKEAGMKYIVITSKHHDGFAMFDSAVSDWNVVKATPYKQGPARRPGRGLPQARHEARPLLLQAQDWVNPGGGRLQDGGAGTRPRRASMDEYLNEVAVPQLREILTNYGPDILWWDTPRRMNAERAEPAPRRRRPHPRSSQQPPRRRFQAIPKRPSRSSPPPAYDRDWETCMTMNDTWGYKCFDNNWKCTKTLIHNLIDIARRGATTCSTSGQRPRA